MQGYTHLLWPSQEAAKSFLWGPLSLHGVKRSSPWCAGRPLGTSDVSLGQAVRFLWPRWVGLTHLATIYTTASVNHCSPLFGVGHGWHLPGLRCSRLDAPSPLFVERHVVAV
jgi:hypothetical protein